MRRLWPNHEAGHETGSVSDKPGWTRPADIRGRLEKRWRSGQLLRDTQQPEANFPLRLPLKKPTSRELADRFEAARDWVGDWRTEVSRGGFVLEWQAINHRQLGRNQLPGAVVLATPEQALALIGKLGQARRFIELRDTIADRLPPLADWCLEKPLKVLEKAEDWPRLLATLDWIKTHPRPGIYLRQLEIPGVHTKFIESQRGLLGELLDRLLPEAAIDRRYSGASEFEGRYGFLTKPWQVRLRFLDPAHAIAGLTDLQIPVADFNRLAPAVETVYIVENAITALAFPARFSALVIFGQGYGVDRLLGGADWLWNKKVFYWGDLDTHGFAILDQLRGVLPHARSLLMDAHTLESHRGLWGQEPTQARHSLNRLTAHEQAAYRMLIDNTLGERIRLEQERISLGWLDTAFAMLTAEED